MSKLEAVVRPFQIGDVFTARVLPPLQPALADVEDVVLTWGAASPFLSKQIGIPDLHGGVKWKEVSRTTKVVRISQESNPDNWVDVEKILAMRLKDEKGQEHFLDFNQ